MKVFRFMSPTEAAAALTGLPLKSHKDHTSYAHTESRGFCFFPYVQHVWGYGERDGWYGRHYATVGIREAEGFFSFRPARSVVCLVLDVPAGSMVESHGRYNLEKVLRLEYDGEPSVFYGYAPVTGTLREYCCEAYPEGYRVLAAYSSGRFSLHHGPHFRVPWELDARAGRKERKPVPKDAARGTAREDTLDILRRVERYLSGVAGDGGFLDSEAELLRETRLAIARIASLE